MVTGSIRPACPAGGPGPERVSGGANSAEEAHEGAGGQPIVGVDFGQELAVVVPTPGVEPDPALAESLLAHCQAHLARFKCPREVRFSGELPRSEAGKIVKRELRAALESADGT